MKMKFLFIAFTLLLCHYGIAQQTVSLGQLVEYPGFNSSLSPRVMSLFGYLLIILQKRSMMFFICMMVKCCLMRIPLGISKNGGLMKL